MAENLVRDASSDKKYFTIIPNIVTELGLSPFAVALYVRLKRRAGEGGECWENTRNLAEGCKMSAGQVSKAKRELSQAGLITVTTEPGKHGGRPYHVITVNDIWARNAERFPSSLGELASSLGEPKNNPIKNNRRVDSGNVNSEELVTSLPSRAEVGGRCSTIKPSVILRMLEQRHQENPNEPAGPFDTKRIERAIEWVRRESEHQVSNGKAPLNFADAVLERYDLLATRARIDRTRVDVSDILTQEAQQHDNQN